MEFVKLIETIKVKTTRKEAGYQMVKSILEREDKTIIPNCYLNCKDELKDKLKTEGIEVEFYQRVFKELNSINTHYFIRRIK